MNDEQKNAFYAAFHRFYKGDQHAINLSFMLLEVAHVWDDFIDGDPVEPEKTNQVFRFLIYDIPMNPVYRMIPGMNDHLLNIYLRWRDATEMEQEPEPDFEKTYMLRDGIYDMFSLIAYHFGMKLLEDTLTIRLIWFYTFTQMSGKWQTQNAHPAKERARLQKRKIKDRLATHVKNVTDRVIYQLKHLLGKLLYAQLSRVE